MPHPPYSPILAPKIFLFPRMKKVLKEKCFAHVKEVKQKTAEALKGIEIDWQVQEQFWAVEKTSQ